MILFAQTEAFVLELFHHAVKDIHDTVGFVLPHPAQSTTEILLA